MIIKKSVVRVGVLVALAVFAAFSASLLSSRPAAAADPICAGGTLLQPMIPGEESCTVSFQSNVYVANLGICEVLVTCKTGRCTTVYQFNVNPTYTESGIRNGNAPIMATVVSHSCEVTPDKCALWVPDVGDAEEKGLIGTDAEDGSTILIATAPNDASVVAVISYPFAGFDTYQVPEEYRFEQYWFKVDGCGRWHGGQELGFPASE